MDTIIFNAILIPNKNFKDASVISFGDILILMIY